jgi:hypothetical protein
MSIHLLLEVDLTREWAKPLNTLIDERRRQKDSIGQHHVCEMFRQDMYAASQTAPCALWNAKS